MKIITMCGSIKYYDKILEIAQRLAMNGENLVLVPIYSPNVGINEQERANLGIMHKEKIKMSDAIYVVNVDGYIGDSTKSEIEYASKLNKEIMYLNEVKK